MKYITDILRIIIATLIVCFCLSGVVTAVNQTPIGSKLISFTPETETVEIGNPIVINGVIDTSILGISIGNALLIVKAPKPSKFDAFTPVAVREDGTFTYSIPTDNAGTWPISIRYGDEVSPVSDVIVTPRTTILKTTNLLNSYTAPGRIDNDLTMTGYLRDAQGVGMGDKEIVYQVAIPPYGCSFCSDDIDSDYLIWETYGTVITDSSGRYILSFTPHDRGNYKVKTYFAGDEAYQGSLSGVRSIQVG